MPYASRPEPYDLESDEGLAHSLEMLSPAVYDPFAKYKSVAESNPFAVTASYRETLKDREAYFPSLSPTNHRYPRTPLGLSLRQHEPQSEDPPSVSPASSSTTRTKHSRAISEPQDHAAISRPVASHRKNNQGTAVAGGQRLSKSLSSHAMLENRNPTDAQQRQRGSLTTRAASISMYEKVDNPIHSYKVTVRDPETASIIVRSPMKKLFGEGGLLSKNTQDLRTSPGKVNSLARRVKQRVDTFMDAIPSVDLLSAKRLNVPPVSTFSITLSQYAQGFFYMRLELMLHEETNNFLLREFEAGRVSHESVRRLYEWWKNQGRAQVIAFKYDLLTQRELVALNVETLHFSGANAFSRPKLVSVLAGWKVLARELSVRTFCYADSAVKKHLADAERVLELIGSNSDSMSAFQQIRCEIMSEIYRQELLQKEKAHFNGVERAWSPSKTKE